MNKLSLLTLIILISFSYTRVNAALWVAENDWDADYEKAYNQWISSSNVHTTMFTDPKSFYHGLNPDCADVTYAFRAIFSYENKLPFAVKNPVARKGSKYQYWTQELTKWDSIKDESKKIVKFLTFLRHSLGTETLSHNDSYPREISTIGSGDFFTYKIKSAGEFVRHSYNITGVTEVGFFNLIYSNQDRVKKKKPMGERTNFSLKNRPLRKNWGFKRFKSPEMFELDYSEYPQEANYSSIQYQKAKELSEKEFFRWVNDLLKKRIETPNQMVKRHLDSICTLAIDRIDSINAGWEHAVDTNHQCMDYRDYDTYSTPSRDKTLKSHFSNFKDDWNELRIKNMVEIDPDLEELAVLILETQRWDDDQIETLNNYCEIKALKDATIHMGQVYYRSMNSLMSFHPNDNPYQRWGINKGQKTKCKTWYD